VKWIRFTVENAARGAAFSREVDSVHRGKCGVVGDESRFRANENGSRSSSYFSFES